LGKQAFMSKKKMFKCGQFEYKRIVKSLLWSVVLYVSEIWSVTQADTKQLEAVEIWIWRLEKISWVDKISNEEVLQRVNELKLR